MRRVCGVRTVKGAVTFCGVMSVFYILIKIYKHSTRARNRGINHEDVIRLGLCAFVFILGMFFLKYTFLMLRRYLVRICFIIFSFPNEGIIQRFPLHVLTFAGRSYIYSGNTAIIIDVYDRHNQLIIFLLLYDYVGT